jgi:hypothetical protein
MPVFGLHHIQVFRPAGGEAAARGSSPGQLGRREPARPETDGLWFEVPGGGQHRSVGSDPHKRRYVFDPFGNTTELDQTE